MIRSISRKAVVFAATSMIGVGALASCTSSGGDTQPAGTGTVPKQDSTPTAKPIPSQAGALEPGTYAVRTLDPDFDGSYRITMDVPDGYYGFPDGSGVAKIGRIGQMAVGAWVVGNVYADPCRWSEHAPRPTVGVVGRCSRRRPRGPAGTPRVDADRHHGRRLRRYVHGADGACRNQPRRLRRGHVPALVRHRRGRKVPRAWSARPAVDHRRRRRSTRDRCLAREAGTSAQDRAAHIQIAESVRIDPQ